MRFRLLGPVQAIGDDNQLVALAGEKERILLASVALGANQVVSVDRLIDALWGEDPPATAANTLQAHVSRLRKRFAAAGAPEALESAQGGYVLRVGPGEVDAARFEELVRTATGGHAEVTDLLGEALALWRGPALADVPSDALRGERARLEELRLLAHERRIEADLSLGRHADLVGEIEALVQADPLREGPRRQLMLALYRSGRQADALATYRAAREALAEELGIDPGPELQAVELAILNQDPELDAPIQGHMAAVQATRPSGTVTLLFSDIEGSTRLWEEHPEEMAVALRRHDELMRLAIEESGGYVFKTVGDAFCAAFGTAQGAVSAARVAQLALFAEPWSTSATVRVRMALHTGECEERDGDYFGPALNRIARLASTAHGGQVVLSRATADVVRDLLPVGVGLRDLGTHHLKDLGRPEEVFQLELDGLATDFPRLRSLDNPELLNNLPKLVSSFVGRDAELAEVRSLLEDARLVTLTGAGGSGKTRLALQVAAELLNARDKEVWLVELASLADPALVVNSVASAVGVREESGRPILDTLIDALMDRNLLVVLDNCEHLLDGCVTVVDAVLRSAPGVRMLTTSRQPLAIAGEQVFWMPSLSLPPPGGDVDLDQVSNCDAVRLFVDRAASHRSSFVLDGTNAVAVASICRRLDGMPLAIELVTARLPLLSVADIEERLDDRFHLLTRGSRASPARHQNLRSVIDWSYDLLDEREQAVLCRLSVFVGGFSLVAAESVCADDVRASGDVLDVLGSLVDKNLVQADPSASEVRFRLLETVRQYAMERLMLSGDAEERSVRNAHSQLFLQLAETTASHLRRSERDQWLARLEQEHDNLRSALRHFLSDDPSTEQAMRMAVALRDFWLGCGHLNEGIEALDAALNRFELNDSPGIRAAALIAAGRLRSERGQIASSCAQLSEGLKLARSHGDDTLTAEALIMLSYPVRDQGDLTTALALSDEAVAVARNVDDPSLLADAYGTRGSTLGVSDLAAARRDLAEAFSLRQAMDDRHGMGETLGQLAVLDLREGNFDSARGHLDDALKGLRDTMDHRALVFPLSLFGLVNLLQGHELVARNAYLDVLVLARRTGSQWAIASALLGLAECASATGRHDRAATLHGATANLCHQVGLTLDPGVQSLSEADQKRLRLAMGDTEFDSSYQIGLKSSLAGAVALALEARDLESE